jgi:hypothetical protein
MSYSEVPCLEVPLVLSPQFKQRRNNAIFKQKNITLRQMKSYITGSLTVPCRWENV